MNRIDTLIKDTRRAAKRAGLPIYRLAQEAGLSHAALYKMNDPDWDPKAGTLRALWRYLDRASVKKG